MYLHSRFIMQEPITLIIGILIPLSGDQIKPFSSEGVHHLFWQVLQQGCSTALHFQAFAFADLGEDQLHAANTA
jgi:hypothetical protein